MDPFGPEMHDKHAPTHSKIGGHYCLEFDGLWICEDCCEFHCCHCVEKTDAQKERAEKYYQELDEYNAKNPLEF